MRVNSWKVALAALRRPGDREDQVLGISENEARLGIDIDTTTTSRVKAIDRACEFWQNVKEMCSRSNPRVNTVDTLRLEGPTSDQAERSMLLGRHDSFCAPFRCKLSRLPCQMNDQLVLAQNEQLLA